MVLLILSLCGSVFATDTDFRIEIREAATTPKDGLQGDTVKYYINAENIGDSGTQFIECGIYTESQVRGWGISTSGFFAIIPWADKLRGLDIENIENCKSSETNVDTISMYLDKGQEYDGNLKFELVIPYTDPDDEYVVFCDAFKLCYGDVGFEEVENRVTDYDMIAFDVKDAGKTTETCSDGILNQDETDTDCGGRCNECPKYYHCLVGSDCETGNCEDSLCVSATTSDDDDDDSEEDDEESDEEDEDDENEFDIQQLFKDYWLYFVAGAFLLMGAMMFIFAMVSSMRGG